MSPIHTSKTDTSSNTLVILLPVFDDWEAVQRLLVQLDGVFTEWSIESQVLIVNDGSTTTLAPVAPCPEHDFQAIVRVDILHLRRNLGHQRAIAIGLAYIEGRVACRAVVLMDSDGEDDPRDVPRLLEKYQQEAWQKIIFAERTRRSESILFRVFYWLYKVVHVLLTGRSIYVGNFSVIPFCRLSSLVAVSEMWNHYAAAVFTSHQPFDSIPTTRAKRLDGQSKMNFVKLVAHGLSVISTYSDIVGVRLLLVTSVLIIMALVGIVSIAVLRLGTDLAIPGWATYTVGILLMLLVQAVMFAFIFSFVILAGRSGLTFLPLRDYRYFVSRVETVYKRRCQATATSVQNSICLRWRRRGKRISAAT